MVPHVIGVDKQDSRYAETKYNEPQTTDQLLRAYYEERENQ